MARGQSPTDLSLTAHELTHVVQQTSGGTAQRKLARGEPGDTYQQETVRVADRIPASLRLRRTIGNRAINHMLANRDIDTRTRKPNRKQERPGKQPIQHALNPVVIQRGEAPVHEDIEKTATDGIDEKLLKEMYAGNWMRDFSQLNLPMPHNLVKKLPKNVANPTGESIGARGAEDIITAVIRVLAFLHFGPEITNELITSENIGVYTPEQHDDNPMGTTAEDHLVRDSQTGLMRPALPQYTTENPTTAPAEIYNEDTDRDEQSKGRPFQDCRLKILNYLKSAMLA